jgi:hypothetical protein
VTERLPIFEQTVAACATRRDGSRHAWRTPAPKPSPRPRPRVTAPAGREHEWSVPATLIRVVGADCLLVEADLGWRQRVQTYAHLYGVIGPVNGREAVAFIESVIQPGQAVTVVSHQQLEPCGAYPLVLASVTLPDGRDLSTLLLGRDLVSPGRFG